MKKAVFILFVFLVEITVAFAQEKLAGKYYEESRGYAAKDTGVIVSPFNEGLAPFMIKGKNPFYSNNNRVGFIDTAGHIIIKPIYNNCSSFHGKYAIVSIDSDANLSHSKMGVIDKNGNVKIPISYGRINFCVNGLFRVWKDNKLGFIDVNNNVVVPFGKYTRPTSYPDYIYEEEPPRGFLWFVLGDKTVPFDNYVAVRSGKKWGVINSIGKETVSPAFEEIGIFKKNLASFKSGKKYGIINGHGKILIPAKYDKIEILDNRYCKVYLDKNTGVVDINNRMIVPVEFDIINRFGNGFDVWANYSYASPKNYYALYDVNGNLLAKAPFAYTDLGFWTDNHKYFVYSTHDKQIHQYQALVSCQDGITRDGYYFYKRDSLWGLMDTTSAELTPAVYDKYECITIHGDNDSENLLILSKNKKYGLLTVRGKTVLNFLYDEFIRDWNRRFYVRQYGKYGIFEAFFNPKISVKQIVPPKYDTISVSQPYDNHNATIIKNFFMVRIGKKWGLLDYWGHQIVPVKFDNITMTASTFAVVKNAGKFGLINMQGRQVINCVYDTIYMQPYWHTGFKDTRQLVGKKGGKIGFINADGVIAEPVYDSYSFCDEMIILSKSGKFGTMDHNGKIIDDFIYSSIACGAGKLIKTP